MKKVKVVTLFYNYYVCKLKRQNIKELNHALIWFQQTKKEERGLKKEVKENRGRGQSNENLLCKNIVEIHGRKQGEQRSWTTTSSANPNLSDNVLTVTFLIDTALRFYFDWSFQIYDKDAMKLSLRKDLMVSFNFWFSGTSEAEWIRDEV